MRNNFRRTLFPFISAMILVPQAHAGRGGLCQPSVATTSTYFVPSVQEMCNSSKPCPEFKKQVKLQGSGTLPGNKLMTYQGKVIDMGDCETAKGASGNCLIPYVSVAADADYYQMGDIIEMPSMKGQEITLPSGRKMKHPGYFIVEDTGGAIQGKNRFDFFTGGHDMHDKNNAFGSQAPDTTQMIAQDDCSSRKNFAVIRRGSTKYKQSQVAIDRSLHAAGEETIFASNLSSPSYGGSSDKYGVR